MAHHRTPRPPRRPGLIAATSDHALATWSIDTAAGTRPREQRSLERSRDGVRSLDEGRRADVEAGQGHKRQQAHGIRIMQLSDQQLAGVLEKPAKWIRAAATSADLNRAVPHETGERML